MKVFVKKMFFVAVMTAGFTLMTGCVIHTNSATNTTTPDQEQAAEPVIGKPVKDKESEPIKGKPPVESKTDSADEGTSNPPVPPPPSF